MAKNRKNKKSLQSYLGRYTLPDGTIEVGDLHLDGPRTNLALHSDNNLNSIRGASYLRGRRPRAADLKRSAENHRRARYIVSWSSEEA